jgi:hypothetical protein
MNTRDILKKVNERVTGHVEHPYDCDCSEVCREFYRGWKGYHADEVCVGSDDYREGWMVACEETQDL